MIAIIPTPKAEVSEAFNAMLANLLRYMADKKNNRIDIAAIRKFLATHDASQPPFMLATFDVTKAKPGTNDARTNAILQASLLIVAALVRGGTNSPDYDGALAKLSEAVQAVIESLAALNNPLPPEPRPRRKNVPRKKS